MTNGSDHLQRRGNQIAAVALLVAIIGTVGTYLAIPDDETSSSEAAAPVPDAALAAERASAGPSADVPQTNDVQNLVPGTCLSPDETVLPCDVPHAREVFAVAANCSDETLVAFLGGVTNRDVLRADLTLTEQPDGACVVELPAKAAVTRSLQDVLSDGLTEDRSPWLRRCFDARSEQDVDCGSYHTAEYVWERQRGSLESIDCTARAGEYIDTSIGSLFRTLAVEDLSTNDTELCRISVKGSNSLVGSIRSNGSRAVPLGPS